jgi:hypothetical protein
VQAITRVSNTDSTTTGLSKVPNAPLAEISRQARQKDSYVLNLRVNERITADQQLLLLSTSDVAPTRRHYGI